MANMYDIVGNNNHNNNNNSNNDQLMKVYWEELMKNLSSMRESSELCDMLIYTDDESKIIRAHSCILAASSEAFHAYLVNKENTTFITEIQSKCYKVTGLTSEELTVVIDFIYGIVPTSDQQFKCLKTGAEKLQICSAKLFCSENITTFAKIPEENNNNCTYDSINESKSSAIETFEIIAQVCSQDVICNSTVPQECIHSPEIKLYNNLLIQEANSFIDNEIAFCEFNEDKGTPTNGIVDVCMTCDDDMNNSHHNITSSFLLNNFIENEGMVASCNNSNGGQIETESTINAQSFIRSISNEYTDTSFSMENTSSDDSIYESIDSMNTASVITSTIGSAVSELLNSNGGSLLQEIQAADGDEKKGIQISTDIDDRDPCNCIIDGQSSTCAFSHLGNDGITALLSAKTKPPKLYMCLVNGCKYECKRLPYMQSHIYNRHGHGHPDIECDECRKQFFSQRQMLIHKRQCHGISASDRNYSCEDCQQTFKSMQSVKTHQLRVHKKGELFSCEDCSFKTPRKKDLQGHLLSQHGRNPSDAKVYKCHWCDYRCIDKSRYVEHGASHTEEKQFKCDLCEKVYATKRALRNHLKYHSDDKPFVCPVCSSGFKVRAKLKDHIRLVHTHKGEKPFKCGYCDFHAAVRGNTNQHIRNIHKGKPICVIDTKCHERRGVKCYDYADLSGSDITVIGANIATE